VWRRKMESIKPIKLRFRLIVKTPTAVTTGEEYYDNDYVVKNGKFLFLNKEKFLNRLKSAGKLREFLELTNDTSVENLLRLRKFIYELVKEEDAEYSSPIDKDFERIYRRNVISIEEILSYKKKRALNEVNRLRVRKIFRDSITKKPYIPGSTLKGAIRTAIINYILSTKENLQIKADKNDRNYTKNADKELNKLLFCQPKENFEKVFKAEPSRDLMRFIKISDFKAVEVEERVGVSYNYNPKKTDKSIPVNLEYINSGIFEGDIILYPDYAKEIFELCNFELNEKNLIKVLKRHYNKVYNREKKTFEKSFPITKEYVETTNQSLLKIGFHAGALSKTVSNDELRIVGNKRTGKRNVPTTTWVLNDKPMGWTILEVIQ